MAKALPAGRRVRGRPMFGLFDADGWGWATTKAVFWLLVLIITLGYVPDRAYYFVVSRTLELGILGWSPVNLCPPENGAATPCPAPAGGIVPWQGSPAEAALPAGRTNGTAVQLGTNLLYIGGNDANGPTTTTYVATIENGNFGGWTEGPALPEARADAAITSVSGTAYLIGGTGPDGAPTTTIWEIGLDPDTSALTEWTPVGDDPDADPPVPGLALPEGRSGASAAAVSDGIVVAGGRGPGNAPVATVWKTTIDEDGVFGEFTPQPDLTRAVADASLVFEGSYLWMYGGSDASGPTNVVQRAQFGTAAEEEDGHGAAATPTPAPSGTPAGEQVAQWATMDAANLTAPRSGGAGWSSNGALYLAGGTDGTAAKRELFWAVPDANGDLPGGWKHLDATDLPSAVSEAAPVVSGSTIFLLGGSADGGAPSTGSFRASLAPQAPFFRLGIAGVVVPGLQIGGEIGQQLGYLAAAGVGTGNFVLLVALAYALNHRRQIADWRERRRIANAAKAPKAS